MKAKSTIQKQIYRLRRLAKDETRAAQLRQECYEAYHALRWVIDDFDTSPAVMAEKRLVVPAGWQQRAKETMDRIAKREERDNGKTIR